MAADNQDVTITAQCLCKAHTFNTQVPQSKLPLQGWMCHCTSCRNLTGAMYTSGIVWPGLSDEIINSGLKTYVFTSAINLLFCGACSSPMFATKNYPDKSPYITVRTGVLNNNVKDLIKFTDQIFVGDTEDGGVSPWLQHVNQDGEKPRLWKGRDQISEELNEDWSAGKEISPTESARRNDIPIQCRCKGIDFMFRPSNADFSSDSVPFYIDPTSHKHFATLDPCRSCRLSVGTDIMSWTFALLKQIDFASTSDTPFPRDTLELKEAVDKADRDARFGTLAIYRSSPDVQRYFCSHCSATVFYTVDDRPDVIDVSVGLLHSPEGSRAEGILAWHLGAKGMGEEEYEGSWRGGFAKSVKDASERWRVEKGYPKTWARRASEGAQTQS
ncbi:hypothetical protein F53441_11731 [Fusarium austroafricanum]|uniref:CENP-V/GFA domain-containing protein n=1 Tax=Fusarium austroafricanum TaxID=2364996 RepID=A0A8H4K287_9HYPO|nr:hypothetical protein F53441_11731 [Fusarium austroafricanum]